MIGLLVVGLFVLVVAIPLLAYTFLIFPNIDGVVQDLNWYNYDEDSRHHLFWTGFWIIAIVSVLFGKATASSKENDSTTTRRAGL